MMVFVERPVSLILISASVLLLVVTVMPSFRKAGRQQESDCKTNNSMREE